MTAPNHIAGGIVITGICGSFMSINILSSPWYLGVVAFASILPDIDHPKSILGRVLFPISKYINRKYGHRTITHSAFFTVMMVMIANLIFKDPDMVSLFAIGYCSHLFLDMITIQGVPLFYPFMRNSFVLPGDRSFRISTGNIRQEGMFFSVMILSALWLQPLMKSGFWTQYNRTFATTVHLVSEFHKTDDLLRVDWTIKDGIEKKQGWGWCVEASENKVVLLDSSLHFKVLDNSEVFIEQVLPSHTDLDLIFRAKRFENIDVDSLNRMVNGKLIKEMKVNCNNDFVLWNEKLKKTNLKYVRDLEFESLDIEYRTERFEFRPSPRIEGLKKKITSYQKKERLDQQRYEREIRKLEKLEMELENEKDLYKRDKLRDQIREAENVKEVKEYSHEIAELKINISELKDDDRIRKTEKKLDFETKLLEKRPRETRFSGTVEFIFIA